MAATLQTSEKRVLSVRDLDEDTGDNIGREISSLEHLIATGRISYKRNFKIARSSIYTAAIFLNGFQRLCIANLFYIILCADIVYFSNN